MDRASASHTRCLPDPHAVGAARTTAGSALRTAVRSSSGGSSEWSTVRVTPSDSVICRPPYLGGCADCGISSASSAGGGTDVCGEKRTTKQSARKATVQLPPRGGLRLRHGAPHVRQTSTRHRSEWPRTDRAAWRARARAPTRTLAKRPAPRSRLPEAPAAPRELCWRARRASGQPLRPRQCRPGPPAAWRRPPWPPGPCPPPG